MSVPAFIAGVIISLVLIVAAFSIGAYIEERDSHLRFVLIVSFQLIWFLLGFGLMVGLCYAGGGL